MYQFAEPRILTEPPEERISCVLVVDTSGSMVRCAHELQQAIVDLVDTINADDSCCSRVELCLITYSDEVRVVQPFVPARTFKPPHEIECYGLTSTHQAIRVALDEISRRKAEYRANGMTYRRPLLWLFTDGNSTDADNGSYAELLQLQEERKLVFFGVAIGDGVDSNELKAMHKDYIALRISRENLQEIFGFAGPTIIRACKSRPGEQVIIDIPAQIGIE